MTLQLGFLVCAERNRDEKVAIFSTYLDEGENEIVYSMRAERPENTGDAVDYGVGDTCLTYTASRSHDIVVEMPTLAGFSTVKEPELNRNHNIALLRRLLTDLCSSGEVFSDKVLGPRLEAQGQKKPG